MNDEPSRGHPQADPSITHQEREHFRQGLRMAHPPSEERLAREREQLQSLEQQGALARGRGFLKFVGPGYLQSAMTLGGGTASASLFAGALFGYQLLWVAPVAMLLGVIVLAAVSHQTLSTGMRPYQAMLRYAGAPFAWGWAIGAILSSVIWQFAQYSLASAVLVDMGEVLGLGEVRREWMGVGAFLWAIGFSMLYGSSATLVRGYERALKYMVWGIVVCFALVVWKTGVPDWGAVFRGYFSFSIPDDRNGVAGFTLVISGLSAAVGVNMIFLYPYSLLARGWGREHRRLARFDLLTGMLLPYALATSLMVIATANTIHVDENFQGSNLSPVQAAQSLAQVVGPTWGRVIFNLGVLAMALSSITLQMLTAGFVCSEWFGWPVGSWRYRLATLIPAPGVLGAFFWSEMAIWVAVPTNILCGLFLPISYFGFIRLQRSREYLGEDQPRGPLSKAWLGGMIFTALFLTAFLGWYALTKGPAYFENLFASE